MQSGSRSEMGCMQIIEKALTPVTVINNALCARQKTHHTHPMHV